MNKVKYQVYLTARVYARREVLYNNDHPMPSLYCHPVGTKLLVDIWDRVGDRVIDQVRALI